MSRKFIDLTGQRFGQLIVIEYHGKDKYGHSLWLCKCDCGNEKIILGYSLCYKETKSCGCYRKSGEYIIKHGHSYHPLFNTWRSMLRRCNDQKCSAYKCYGDRGITVCERWSNKKNGFENFIKDVGEKPKGKSIDRINNDGNYEPNNWKWSTPKEQARNRRTNINITINGEKRCKQYWINKLVLQNQDNQKYE